MSGDYSSANRVVSMSSANIQFQGEEIIFPGSSILNIMTVPNSSAFAFAGAFCIELFGVKFDTNNVFHGLISFYNVSGSQRSWGIQYNPEGDPDILQIALSTDGVTPQTVNGTFTPTVGQPYDLCFERDGSDVVRNYVDGVMIGSGTISGALFNSNQPVDIGLGNRQTSDPFDGRMKAIRITAAARYASDAGYTVPTLPLPTRGPA